MESHFTLPNGLAGILSVLEGIRAGSSDLANKIEHGLQISVGRVTFRNDDLSSYRVTIGQELGDKPAVLFYHPKFYQLNGFPKYDEYVIIMHNNGNSSHILFSANPKDILVPPFKGPDSTKAGLPSSSKCML